VIDLELVVHQDNARVRDERRGIARDVVVVDDVEVVSDFDGIQLGRRVTELRVPLCHPQQTPETREHDQTAD
jgi:hypothetical protein